MRRFHLKRGQIAIAATALVALIAAGIAMGLQPTSNSGRSITAVRAVESSDIQHTVDTSYVVLNGSLTPPITVTTSGGALMLVHFSAESTCALLSGGLADTGCFVKIQLLGPNVGDETDALPRPTDLVNEFNFDTATSSDLFDRDGNSMDRWLVVTQPGTYRARVQFKVGHDRTRFSLDDWSLIFERADKF